jgi:hypothetical protein
MQADGNLVLYRVDNGVALWASNTPGQPVTHTVMQSDGNLVCYDNNGRPYWATNTNGNPGAWLLVQDDGNLVVYSAGGVALWASNTVQTWPLMRAVENVSLVREQSSAAIYLVVGNTKFWITDPTEFNTLGFDWLKVRILVDDTLAGYTEQRLHAAPATRPSDVFFDCGDVSNAPPWFGTFYGNCKPSSSIVRKDVLLAGWLRKINPNDSNEAPPIFVNYTAPGTNGKVPGLEDVHYTLFLDAVFVNRVYGLGGLSTALSNAVWPGNPPDPSTIPFATDPPLTPGGPAGASYNSFILPNNGEDVHVELNAWHVNDTNPNTFFSVHWRGRGQQPALWVNPGVSPDNDAWFPFNPLDPEGLGYQLKEGDYVLMRGALWQENDHGLLPLPVSWRSGPTLNYDGYTEMHPPDWIVRVREPNPNARVTVGRRAPASEDVTGPQMNEGFSITPDFTINSPTGRLQVRTVKCQIDHRFTIPNSVVTVGEQVSATQDSVNVTLVVQPTQARVGNNTTASTPFVTADGWVYFRGTDNTLWKVFNDGSQQARVGNNTTASTPFVTTDGWVDFQGTDQTLWKVYNDGSQQARFKGSWLVGWREIDEFDQIWVDDQTPAGATLVADGDPWDWRGDNVFSGKRAHRSALKQGMHQHYFLGAPTPIQVNWQDTLIAMVFLDPDNPPDEVMLQWHTTDWLSRAYWGANLIDWGTDGTTQRHFMGPLPPSGEWVLLTIPAQAVGINGAVDGIAFTLYNGRATWDYVGLNKSSIFQ